MHQTTSAGTNTALDKFRRFGLTTPYWKVKDFCKRTGKRCVFVENPSTSALVRGLEQISDKEAEVAHAEQTSLTLRDSSV